MRSRDPYDLLQLRADLWRVPLALCIVTEVLFLATVFVDRAAARGTLGLPSWLSVGGADDARAILGAMLGAVSTVLALIFSVALLVLSMATTQFGPRILYRFVRDGVTQVTIGLFLASFVHTLLTFVVTRQDANRQFVPQLTLICSVILVMMSFACLILFSHRIAMSIQTQNVVARIVGELDASIAGWMTGAHEHPVLRRTPAAEAERESLVARCAAEGGVVRAPRTGFVQAIDVVHLLSVADQSGAVVSLLYRPGQFVMEGAALAQVLPEARTADLTPALLHDVWIGTHRTLEQDFEFGMAQLVEIALRALSPAINDTFTGLTCIDWLGDALRGFASHGEYAAVCLGASGTTRLVWPPLRFARLVKAAFDQIRQAAMGNPAVTIRLLQTFTHLAEQIEDARLREPLSQQVEALWEAEATAALVKSDRADVEKAYRRACEALIGQRLLSAPSN